jgi:hypothetical protein
MQMACFFVLTFNWPAQSQYRYGGDATAISALVDTFYKRLDSPLFWFGSGPQSDSLRSKLLSSIKERGLLEGLDSQKYLSLLSDNLSERSHTFKSSDSLVVQDRKFTAAAFGYLSDLYRGDPQTINLGSDELSGEYLIKDQQHLVSVLAEAKTAILLEKVIDEQGLLTPTYIALRQKLKEALVSDNMSKMEALRFSLNVYRWLYHFRFKKYIVVNIPSAELYYYENDSLCLSMKVVVGKRSTKTPRLATYCDQVILFPYWNVPRSIAVNEILPLCKKKLTVLDEMKMQVINERGAIVDPHKLNWKSFSKHNFPYRFRQSTGCDNSLGVIKFNLTSPYSVYMHDTNSKQAFESEKRFLSHGCIRLEKPVDLANRLLGEKLDDSLLKDSLSGKPSMIKPIAEPVPVFVLYMTANATSGNDVRYYPDIYSLF